MLRVIGDVHGKINQYKQLIHNIDYSIQVGDMAFDYSSLIDDIDPIYHKFIKGNHDNHDEFSPHCLPKYGYVIHGGIEFFYMQGAFSIDWQDRLRYDQLHNTKSWWHTEQLSFHNLEKAVELYQLIKPDLVVTHEAPRSVVEHFDSRNALVHFGYDPDTFTTHTSEALQAMLDINRPARWFFGHYHNTKKMNIGGTEFTCLDELNYEDIE